MAFDLEKLQRRARLRERFSWLLPNTSLASNASNAPVTPVVEDADEVRRGTGLRRTGPPIERKIAVLMCGYSSLPLLAANRACKRNARIERRANPVKFETHFATVR
jgi:hypothetical protein